MDVYRNFDWIQENSPNLLKREREKANNDGTSFDDPAGSFNDPCNFNNQQMKIDSKSRVP
jgi:hypothetical protein